MNSAMLGTIALALFNALMLPAACGLPMLWARRWKQKPGILHTLGLAGLIPAAGLLAALLCPADLFFRMQLLTWALLLHTPVYLAVLSIVLFRRQSRLAPAMLILSLAIAAVAVDAVLIEPRWLQVTRHSITSDQLTEPVRIVILADIQTDRPGKYEERILQQARRLDPDLGLLAGDYLQIGDLNEYRQAAAKLNRIFRDAQLNPPLGIYAVQGNIDRQKPWPEIFRNLPVDTIALTRSMDLGPVVLTGLSMEDSFDTQLSVPAKDKFHILLGHCPNFSLGDGRANLLIAGHTHGGQVRLPWIGPLLTFSAVPRSWAAGMTSLGPDKNLIVSRGLGMERHSAPRLRFLCRPELIVVDLLPTGSGKRP